MLYPRYCHSLIHSSPVRISAPPPGWYLYQNTDAAPCLVDYLFIQYIVSVPGHQRSFDIFKCCAELLVSALAYQHYPQII